MTHDHRHDGPHPDYRDPERRDALLRLIDHGFPGLSPRIAAAAAAGHHWDAITEPFVAWDGAEAVGHVGVLVHRVCLAGQITDVAGIHAVVTRADRRGRGIARELLAQALRWVDARFAHAKLGTDLPDVYAGAGFVGQPVHRFHVAHAGGDARGRALTGADRAWFDALVATRTPVSHRLASLDPGWLIGIDLALGRRTLADLTVLDDLAAVVDWDVRDGVLRLHDVFARDLPPLAELLARAPAHTRVELYVNADRLAPDAPAEPLPDEGVWMFRGPWPALAPLAIGRLAQH